MALQAASPCLLCGNKESSLWGRRNGFELFACKKCELVFVDPMPKHPEAIYDESYFGGGEHGYANYDRDKEPMRDALNSYLAKVEKILGKKGKLLDVGAATGYFLEIARSRGWRVAGVELSDAAAGEGRKKGIEIYTGTLESAPFEAGSFDVITVFDVLEHVTDPEPVIAKARELLAPQGIIVIITLDTKSFIARALKARWHLVTPPEHLLFYSRKNLAHYLRRAGFSLILVETQKGKKFTLPYIFSMLAQWQKLRIWNLLARAASTPALARLKIPINLRDTFFMIARKK